MTPHPRTVPSSPEPPDSLPVPTRSEKIGPRHLERLAVVYVRQSTPQQLIHNQESTQIQYSLTTRACALGWTPERVVVIDDDLGKSGATAEGRAGFQRLVAEVTLDHVGMVLGVEMSRLARSCKDWYQLLEVCALFGTLIADLDGIYDPAHYNDRLLLGLKGTMSEAELHILKQRMLQGKLHKARRGEIFSRLPFGYVRSESGGVGLDPDEEVREVVRLVFRKFDELGTIHAVLGFLGATGVKFPVRSYERDTKGDLQWRRLNRSTLLQMLRNPMYAGAYAYGRRVVDPRRRTAGGKPVVRRVEMNRFPVLLKDRLPAYITWEQYEQHLERLRNNRAVFDAIGAPKHGPSLLSGLVVCGKCGHRMGVHYDGPKSRHVYYCWRLRMLHGGERCQSLSGRALDEFVSAEALKALEPASLELSLEAARNIENRRQEVGGLWDKRLERARYEVERAARQYQRVEPENRLVAREVEREWEDKLSRQNGLQGEYERWLREQPRVLSLTEREAIARLAADIPALWNSVQTTMLDRKEILRQVIDRVTVDTVGESERVKVTIHWAGGTETHHETVRPVASWEQLSYWGEVSQRIRDLAAQKLTSRQIAERLNAEGWRPPKGRKRFGEQGIQQLWQRMRGIEPRWKRHVQEPLKENEWLGPALARELDIPQPTMYLWIKKGWIQSRRGDTGQWILWADAQELERLRAVHRRPNGYYTRRHWTNEDGSIVRN